MKLFFVVAFVVAFASLSEAESMRGIKRGEKLINVLNSICPDMYTPSAKTFFETDSSHDIPTYGKKLLGALDVFLDGVDVDLNVTGETAETLADNLLKARFRHDIKHSEASVLRAMETVEMKAEAESEKDYEHVTIVVPSVHHEAIGKAHEKLHKAPKGVSIASVPEAHFGCTIDNQTLPNCKYVSVIMYRDIYTHLLTIHNKFEKHHNSISKQSISKKDLAEAKEIFNDLLRIFESGEILVNWDVLAEYNVLRYALYDKMHSVTICFDFFMEAGEEALEYDSQNGVAGYSILKLEGHQPGANTIECGTANVALETSKDNAISRLDLNEDLQAIAEQKESVLFDFDHAKPDDSAHDKKVKEKREGHHKAHADHKKSSVHHDLVNAHKNKAKGKK